MGTEKINISALLNIKVKFLSTLNCGDLIDIFAEKKYKKICISLLV